MPLELDFTARPRQLKPAVRAFLYLSGSALSCIVQDGDQKLGFHLHCSAELAYATATSRNCQCLSGHLTTQQRGNHVGHQHGDLQQRSLLAAKNSLAFFSHFPKISPEIKSVAQNLIYLLQKYKQLSQTCRHLQYECWSNYWDWQLLAPCCNNKMTTYPGLFESTFHSRPSSSVLWTHTRAINRKHLTHPWQAATYGWITGPPHSSHHRDPAEQHSQETRMAECWSSAPLCLLFCTLIQALHQREEVCRFFFPPSLCNC